MTVSEFKALAFPAKVAAYIEYSGDIETLNLFLALPDKIQMRIGKRMTTECV